MDPVPTLTLDPADVLEKALLGQPQTPAIYRHHFAPGTYTREMIVPAGQFVIGHRHRHACTNICLAGAAVLVPRPGEEARLITAGEVFVGQPGTRKMAITLTELRWLNVHPNPDDTQDLDLLGERLILKTEAFLEHETAMKANLIEYAVALLKGAKP